VVSDAATLHDVVDRINAIQERLEELIEEHRKAADEFAAAEAAYERAFLTAHVASLEEHPTRKVDAHNSYARHAAVDAYEAREAAKATEMVIRHAQHSLRQVLSAYQTLGKFVADEAGHNRYGRSR
jgi:primosomal protein N''